MTHPPPTASRRLDSAALLRDARVGHLALPRGPRLEFAEQGPPPGPGVTSVLMPWGRPDAFVPEAEQQRIVRTVRAGGGTVDRVVHEDIGHALHWERPAPLAHDLVQFVAGLPRPRA